MYRVLGTSDEAAANENENGTSERTEDGVTDEERGVQDTHLRDYDQEIFDDDDFYHQVRVRVCLKKLVHELDKQRRKAWSSKL